MVYPVTGTRFLMLLLSGLVSLITSCGKDGLDGAKGHVPGGPASPQPPPPGSVAFELDLEALDISGAGTNHRQAIAHTKAVSVSIGSRLQMPTEILANVKRASPVMTAQDSWIWSYAVNGQNRSWTTNLSGKVLSDAATKWQARVTTSPIDALGCCSDILVLEGESSSVGGTWQIYDLSKSTKAEKLLSVTYGYEDDAQRSMQLTANAQRVPGERLGMNSVVTYQVSGDLVDLQILDSSEGAVRKISWSKSTKAGSHTDLQGNRVCWAGVAERLADKVCD